VAAMHGSRTKMKLNRAAATKVLKDAQRQYTNLRKRRNRLVDKLWERRKRCNKCDQLVGPVHRNAAVAKEIHKCSREEWKQINRVEAARAYLNAIKIVQKGCPK
jgi:hypothetical protein